MANGTTNSDPGGQRGANLPKWGQRSANSELGIERRVECGTSGSREDAAGTYQKYGGESHEGVWFKGTSANSPPRETNSGKSESTSGNRVLGGYGPPSGTVGSRENMPTYGKQENRGKLVGKGAGATGNSKPASVYTGSGAVPSASTSDVVSGTNADRKEYTRSKFNQGGSAAKNKR